MIAPCAKIFVRCGASRKRSGAAGKPFGYARVVRQSPLVLCAHREKDTYVKKIAIVMGSKSDLDKAKAATEILDKFGVPYAVRVLSAHRTPDEAAEFARSARSNGFAAIIAVAGKAAHLGGVLAAATTLPVIALPVSTSFLDGLDSVLSILPMPSGVPVAVMGVNAGANAGLFCVRVLAATDDKLDKKYAEYVENMRKSTLADDAAVRAQFNGDN